MKRPLSIATLCLASWLASLPAAAQAVRVGIMNVPPMGGAEPGGYCFDLMTELAKRAGIEVTFQPMPFSDLPAALTGHSVEALCSLHSASARWRQQGLMFTSSIMRNSDGLVVRASAAAPYRALVDLADQPVGIVAGAPAFAQMVADAGAKAREYPNPGALYQAVLSGEVTAALISTPAFLYRQKVLGELADLKLVEGYASQSASNHVALAVRQGEITLLGQLQAGLEGMKADGSLTKILETWALPPPVF